MRAKIQKTHYLRLAVLTFSYLCSMKIYKQIRVNKFLPLLFFLVIFTSCSRKYKIEGVSSVSSLDGRMLFIKTLEDGKWVKHFINI